MCCEGISGGAGCQRRGYQKAFGACRSYPTRLPGVARKNPQRMAVGVSNLVPEVARDVILSDGRALDPCAPHCGVSGFNVFDHKIEGANRPGLPRLAR